MISALKARGIKRRGRRPADADRADRRAGPDRARRFPAACRRTTWRWPRVLKSPLFGLDDDDLLALAPERQGLAVAGAVRARRRRARARQARAETLQRWRARAERLPPFEFYAGLLDADDMRAPHAGAARRRGGRRHRRVPQPGAGLRRRRAAVAAGLPGWLREGSREIKRDMEQGRDEVRVMTVHGAKGLEAPIVFLPDTCSTRSARQPGGLLMLDDAERPAGTPPPFLWPVKGTERARASCSRRKARDRARRGGGAQPPALRGPDARARPAVCGGLRRRATRRRGLLVQSDPRRARRTGCSEVTTRRRPRRRGASPARRPPSPRPSTGRAPAVSRHCAAAGLGQHAGAARAADHGAAGPIAPRAARERCEARAAERSRASAPGRAADPAARRRWPTTRRFLRGTLTHALLEHLPALPQAALGRGGRRRSSPAAPRSCRPACARASWRRRWPSCATRRSRRCSAREPRRGGDRRRGAAAARPRPALRLAGKIDRLVRGLDRC